MENADELVSFPLLHLPFEVIEVISHYLSIKDLCSCCATSRRMRQIFNDNMIWKGRCDQKLADYLKITECKIEPGFVNPEVNNSTLSPICERRIGFMLENHLWNNWRQGKYTKQEITSQHDSPHHGTPYFHFFFSSDFVIARHRDRIEILDVRKHPHARILRFDTSGFDQCLEIIPSNSSLILMYNSCVQVYDINVVTNQYSLKQVFFFNESNNKVAIGPGEQNKIFALKKSVVIKNYCVLGTYFVGMINGESTMHIWNFETGLKLKSEVCPLKNSTILSVKSSKTNNLIFNISQNSNHLLLAYNLPNLCYLPFRETFKSEFEYTVYNDFVAVYTDSLLHVFNYVTSEIILKNQPSSLPPQIMKNSLVFCQGKRLYVFNLCSQLVEPLPIIENVAWFEVLTDKFVQIDSNSSLQVWEMSPVNKTLMRLEFNATKFFLNQTCNRYIVRYNNGYILNFW